jgi:tRNA nucleotidyltransferase (CCA-adding enzyme)
MFRKVIPTGMQHGTVTVLQGGQHYELTTLRGEGAYTDGRRPDSVEFVDDITADLARRDFTFNAIALDPIDGHIIDPFDGQKDLAAKVVRAVGNADERFIEDGLRVLRAARFAATLECVIDPATEAAMAHERSLQTFRKVSAERVRDEWMKTMHARAPSVAFEAMRRTKILGVVCPELLESVGCEQNKWHGFDVWGHAMACLDACKPHPVLRIAALFHDVAKPRTRAFSDKTNDFTFYEHERIGAEMAEPILLRLRFSNEERQKIVALIRHHLICYDETWSDAAVRRWLRRVGPDLAPELYEIGFADARGKGRDASADIHAIEQLRARVEALLAAGAALSAKDLAVNGKDLMTELAIPPGRIIGVLLERLVELVTEDPDANTRERLLEEARRAIAETAKERG